ncbi:hypothetical protein ACQRUO_39455, partial [Kitasatospora sp. LaBMicrA B282]
MSSSVQPSDPSPSTPPPRGPASWSRRRQLLTGAAAVALAALAVTGVAQLGKGPATAKVSLSATPANATAGASASAGGTAAPGGAASPAAPAAGTPGAPATGASGAPAAPD